MKTKLFVNGKIYTSSKEKPFVNSMAIEGEKIIWAGDYANLPKCIYSDSVIDLKGRCVIPGLVDGHMHPVTLAEYSAQIACLPPNVNSIEELVEKIAEEAEKKKGAPIEEWIEGWGYDEGKFKEGRSPNRYDLDRACKDRPVSIVRSCEHIRCVNSLALQMAGINANTPDPEGGEIERDENGIPTGVLKESARNLVVPFMPVKSEEEIMQDLLNLGKLFSSQGIVAVADMGNFREGDNAQLFSKAVSKGFNQRVSIYYMWDFFKDKEDFEVPERLLDGDSKVHVAGLKLIGDGSISGRTAWVNEPYLFGDEDDIGMMVYSDDEMEKAIETAERIGCGISVHCMGARAIDRVLKRFSNVDVPLRIEHVTEPTLEQIHLAKEMGVSIATQPIFMYCEIESYRKNFDTERIKRAYPIKTILDEGVKLCLSTDAPATSWAVPSDPFVNIMAAVTRRAYDGTDLGQSERIDVETAIRLYTVQAAEIMGLEKVGMIKEGYYADFAILDQDIFEIPEEEIENVKVLETYIDGEKVFER